MKEKHRIFIAINLPGDIKKALAGYEKKWSDIPARWTSLNNLHITLVFLGDVTDEELGEVCLATKQIAEGSESFNIRLDKISYGPIGKIPPRYIWAGGSSLTNFGQEENDGELAKNKESKLVRDKKSKVPKPRRGGAGIPVAEGDLGKLSSLKHNLEDLLSEKVSFLIDRKAFVPHITLARIQEWQWRQIEPEERPGVDESIDLNFTVESIEVMESVLRREGPQYEIIESHQLK